MDDPRDDMPTMEEASTPESADGAGVDVGSGSGDTDAAGASAASGASGGARGLLTSQPMRYPNAYAWLMLFSALDIMLTWVILSRPDGREANPLAEWVIHQHGLNGMIIYKFALVLFFVVLCEFVGKLKDPTGSLLSRAGVAIAAFPVVWSLGLLFLHAG